MKEWEYTPAKDHGLKPTEALKSAWREPGLFYRGCHGIWLLMSRAYFRIYHRLSVIGLDSIPAQAPFILVANHSSHLDAPALIASLPRKFRSIAYPLAAGDAFFATNKGSWFGAMFLNALPVWRKRAARHSLEVLRDRLEKGQVVFILFPEGTRTRDGQPAAFKPGIGMLVAGSAVPVIPCYIEGAFEALPPAAKRPKRLPLRVHVSDPVRYSDHSNDRDGWNAVAKDLALRVEQALQN